MSLYCTVSEIGYRQYLAKVAHFSRTTFIFGIPFGVTPLEFYQTLGVRKLEYLAKN